MTKISKLLSEGKGFTYSKCPPFSKDITKIQFKVKVTLLRLSLSKLNGYSITVWFPKKKSASTMNIDLSSINSNSNNDRLTIIASNFWFV